MTEKTSPDCPECDRLIEVAPVSQKIGEFLDWLEGEKGLMIAKYHAHSKECEDDDGSYNCGYWKKDDIQPVHLPRETILAEFFGIDLLKVESEQRALLESLRG